MVKYYSKKFKNNKKIKNYCWKKMQIIMYAATSHNRTVTASPLRRLGVQLARSVAALAPTPPSPTFGRAVLLHKPLCARPNVSYSQNVIRHSG